MKGQTLFIRPIEPADREDVRTFLLRHGQGSAETRSGILAKLVGDLVAVLTMDQGEGDIELHQLAVREDLRRKRIGGLMLNELERIAVASGHQQLRTRASPLNRPFLEKAGFVEEGDFMVRRVNRAKR